MVGLARQVQRVVPDELLLQLLVSWLAPPRTPPSHCRAAGTADESAEKLADEAGNAGSVTRMPAVSAAQSQGVAALASSKHEDMPAAFRPSFLLPPADADIGCLPGRPEAAERGGMGCPAGRDDADDASPPLSGAEQPSPAQPLSICCRRALSLPLSRDGHECGGGSPSSGRAPLQVRYQSDFCPHCATVTPVVPPETLLKLSLVCRRCSTSMMQSGPHWRALPLRRVAWSWLWGQGLRVVVVNWARCWSGTAFCEQCARVIPPVRPRCCSLRLGFLLKAPLPA